VISAKTVADSQCNGHRITTMLVTMPRFILAEFNTHRVFSRNSASSRAIPFEKMVKIVDENPFIPIAWQRDHKGMQGTEYLTAPIDVAYAHDLWLEASKKAIRCAKNLYHQAQDQEPFVTKQLCNRLLEPFMWTTVLVTATEWENFFHLRCPQYEQMSSYGTYYRRSRKDYLKNVGLPDEPQNYDSWSDIDWLKINKGQAEIHMMAVAEAMWDAMQESKPRELKPGEWHIPFGDQIDEDVLYNYIKSVFTAGEYSHGEKHDEVRIKIATARCARTSYTVFGDEGKTVDYQKDIDLHNKLATSGHWSPFEHCARAMNDEEHYRIYERRGPLPNGYTEKDLDYQTGWCRNFKGWVQYRAMFLGENKVI
jgi:thymidylate synthase ThyX